MENVQYPHELIGEWPDDPADLKACVRKNIYTALPPGERAYDWESPSRIVTNPPEVKSGPFTEMHLSPTPAAAIAARVMRLRAGADQQPILQILGDAMQMAIYRVRAPAVRIKDVRLDSRFVGGAVELRRDGELAQERLEDRVRVASVPTGGVDETVGRHTSDAWEAIATGFTKSIAAMELPDDAIHPSLKLDWTLLGSVPRLNLLKNDGPFKLDFLGQSCVTWRDILAMEDIAGRPVGWRFAYYIGREAAHDFISLSRKKRLRDWLGFGIAILTFLSSLGSLGWLVSQLF
ncbi:MAG TPA: hypothetical protein VF081_13665 [Solirubrobacterales bacterium]